MTILLIGAGQLGSRHLQGLLKLEGRHDIFVLDPSSESLSTAELRAKEIPNSSKVEYVRDFELLPKSFELVIIATNSNIRERVVTQLLTKHEVKYLVLEKVLFQQLSSYKKIQELIAKSNVQVWVNHPRRMVKQYGELKKTIAISGEKVVFNLVGGNWGLGCNGLHFLDLFTYLTGDEIACVEENWLDDVIHESKRENYVEFTGTLKGRSTNGHSFTITSFDGDPSPISLAISTSSYRWNIEEGSKAKISSFSRENGFLKIENDFTIDFQSNLTTELAKDLLETGRCNLPTYNEASKTHMIFIESVLKKYNQINGTVTDICPIT